jgi:diacylglycerol diphosphate phosphatase/phosphatidate phosphatase
MYPHKKHEIIPDWFLPFITFAAPSVILATCMACQRFSNKRSLVAFLGLFLALGITLEITTITKLVVGRLRPDFLARCKIDPSISAYNVCRGSAHKIREGRKSFPSGHASMSFAGLGYAALFLAGQLGLFDGRSYAYQLPLVAALYVLAGLVSVTRIMDFRHHWQDVCTGAVLGTFVSWVCYRMYFPSLWHPRCSFPSTKRFEELTNGTSNDCSSVNPDNAGLWDTQPADQKPVDNALMKDLVFHSV